jgi:hypothetical protein
MCGHSSKEWPHSVSFLAYTNSKNALARAILSLGPYEVNNGLGYLVHVRHLRQEKE